MKTIFLILTFTSPFILLSQENYMIIEITVPSQDTDQDGYPDTEDDEPLTPPGVDVDRNGVRLIEDPPCNDTATTTTLHLEARPEEVSLFLVARSMGAWNWPTTDSFPFLVTQIGNYSLLNDPSESYRLALMAVANLKCYESYPAMKINVIGPAEDGQEIIDKLKRDFFLPVEGVRISYEYQQAMIDPVAYFFWE